MAHLDLALLGPLRVALDERPIAHFGYEKVPALLAYLVVEADRPHTRDELAALLWPESSEDAARRSLRVALTKLRQVLADHTACPPLLLVDRTTIQFNRAADYTLDSERFDHLLADVEKHCHAPESLCAPCAARLADAIALYRGEFLAQVRVRDSVAFEEWTALVRERAHQRVVEALSRLMAYHEQHNNASAAAEHYARQLLALEPWDEAAHRCLMRVLVARGQRRAALAQYERCRRILASEFSATPAPETTELYQRIRVADAPKHAASDEQLASTVQPHDAVVGSTAAAALPEPPPVIDRNRQRLLEKVRAFWIDGVLRESLRHATLIAPGLTYRPEAIARPWDLIVRQLDAAPRIVPPDTPISAVFDEMHGELLILGAPGAGKTTLLLELARILLDHAGQDPALPMPVVFNLGSWAARRVPLAEWLVDELDERYQVPRALGWRWVESEQILPLLDGLDEVAPQHRAACVAAINAFRAQHWLLDIVVCSRSADYALVTDKLRLQGAVEIQPLTAAQIDRYLTRSGRRMAAMRAYLQEDAALRELAETPLMLNIMALAYRSPRDAHLHEGLSVEQRRTHLFQTYVRQMLQRREASARYTPQQTVRWLAWLARTLVRSSQTMLLIERLQPHWLPTPQQRQRYTAGVALIVGLVFSVVFSCFGGLTSWLLYGPLAGWWFVGLGGAVSMLVSSLVLAAAMAPAIRRRWFGGTIGRPARNAALFGLAVGGGASALVGAIAGDFGSKLAIGLYSGLLVGMIIGVLVSKIPPGGAIVPIERFQWSWYAARHALPHHFTHGLVFGLTSGTALCLALQRSSGWVLGMANGVGFGLAVALATALVLTINTGLTAHQLEVTIAPNQGIWQSARHMGAIGLAAGLLIGLIGMASNALAFTRFAPAYPLGRALVLGLLYGPTLGFASGLFYGGLACLQHALLRLYLWRLGAMPLNYARFLDYAAERVLLRKVGGGYMFIHRLLLEHFAALDPESPFRLPPATPRPPQPAPPSPGTPHARSARG
jgi:DNA-binding SARP family transcriptional activator/energy-coupling factor transporter ATP-binding protein EcfA2